MDYVGKRKWLFLASALVILPGIAFLIIAGGLKPGIDFTGGSAVTLQLSAPVEQEDLRLELAGLGHPDAVVQRMGDLTFFVRTKELQDQAKDQLVNGLRAAFDLPTAVQVLSPEADPETGSDADSPVTLSFAYPVTEEDVQAALSSLGHADAAVQTGDETTTYLVRGLELAEEERRALLDGLQEAFPPIRPVAFDLVSPVVAFETVRNAFWAVLAAAVGIFLYLWWAFRNVPSPFRYGTAAIVALLHDTAVVIGIFAILGELADIEVNTMFLIALLTVIGYSVNDTIVVFDRIRENILLHPNRTLAANANLSISESLGRSLNTSLTLLITLMALLLFGGPTIRVFLWVLLIGVIAGTYSSIGIATNVLVAWEAGDFRRFFGRSRSPGPSGAR